MLQGIDHATQHIVDSLYINIKNMLINPARNTGIYRERKRKTKHIIKKPRRHGKQVWYNEDCEVSRKECMLLKNSLIHDNTTHIQHQEFHKNFTKRFNLTRNWSLKPNKYTLNSFTERSGA